MRREDGLTIVEVVVAGLILVVGALGVLGIVDAATRNTYRAEQSQVVANVLQAEMEKLRQVPYDELALTALPVHSNDPGDPDWRVTGSSFSSTRDGSAPQALVYNGGSDGVETIEGGTVDPGPTPFAVENVSGTVHRYVVWDECPASLCEDGEFLKRAIVAVRLHQTGVGGARRYQEIQGQLADPEVEPPENPGPGPGDETAQPWTVWLTDTPCNQSTRQPLAGDHQTHNTRGSCTTGMTTKANCTTVLVITNCPPGAPDLMVESAPPDTAEAPLYDYATDVEPLAEADKDVGLTLRKSAGGCNAVTSLWGQLPLVPELLDDGIFQKVHKWVSPPIPSGVDLELNGSGTLSLWTKSINGAVHSGKLCAALFSRQFSTNLFGQPIVVDTPAVNLDLADGLLNVNYFTYQLPQWPSEGWTEVNLEMNFTLNAGLLPGRRLGLALWAAGSGTSGDGIELMYDERSFDSRLELDVDQTVSLPIFG